MDAPSPSGWLRLLLTGALLFEVSPAPVLAAAARPSVRRGPSGSIAPADLAAALRLQLSGSPAPELLVGRARELLAAPAAPAERAAAAAILAAAAQPALLPELRQTLTLAGPEGVEGLRALETLSGSPAGAALAKTALQLQLGGVEHESLDALFDAAAFGGSALSLDAAGLSAPRAPPRLAPAGLRNVEAFFRQRAAPPAPAAAKAGAKTIAVAGPRWYDPTTIPARLLAAGHYGAYSRHLDRIINRLARPDDNPNYSVRLKWNIDPNAAIWPDIAAMEVHLGLLSVTPSEDALAAVIAHEMTHANKEQLKAMADDPQVSAFLGTLEGYKDLPASQREEIRADLGSVERLIEGGYNPWGAYEFEKKLAKLQARMGEARFVRWLFRILFAKSFDYMSTHPVSEVRMAAIKGYIVQRGFREDLTEAVTRRNPLPWSLRLLRWRLMPLTALVTSPWLWYYVAADWTYKGAVWLVGLFSPSKARELDGSVGDLWAPVREAFSGVGGFFRDLLPSVEPPAWLNGSNVFAAMVVLLLGLQVVGLARLILLDYRKTPFYARMAAVSASYRAAAPAFRAPGLLPDARLREQLEEGFARLKDIQDNYQSAAGRLFRWVNGLSLYRLRWLRGVRRLLAEQERRSARAGRPAEFLSQEPPAILTEDRAARESWLRAAGELRPDHPMALAARAEELRRAGAPDEILRVSAQLTAAGLHDTAARLWSGRAGALLERAVGPKPPRDAALATVWASVEKSLRTRRTSSRPGYAYRLGRDAFLVLQRLRRLRSPLEERLAFAALDEDVPLASWPLLSLRGWLRKLDRALLVRALRRSFSSAVELEAFLESRLRPRRPAGSSLRALFHAAVLSRPDWLGSEADLEAVMRAEELWPRFGTRNGGFLEDMLIEAAEENAKRLPGPWSYEPASSEALHRLYLARLEALGLSPRTAEERAALWRRLTERGVTSATDAMFASLLEEAEGPLRERLEDLALAGHIWDAPARAAIAQRRLRESAKYRALLAASDPKRRASLLARLAESLKKDMPDRGIHFARILEDLSQDIRSTPSESAYLQRLKLPAASGEKSEDLALRFLSHVTSEALSWRRSQQWRLILYLRGDAPPSRKIRKAFRTVGPERMKRMYEILPLAARVELLDIFLDSPRGLAGKVRVDGGWAGVIVEHVLPDGRPEARRVARELLAAFLHSLKASGNAGFQSYVLAYMLALPKDETASIGKTLRGVLEVFGATGIKIGQFLAASQLLPEEETRELRRLQEHALEPQREEIYKELRELARSRELPVRLLDLLGAASIKYAVLGEEPLSGEPVVLKVFRQSAVAHTGQEFVQLDHMARYLQRKHGPRYGALKAIVAAAKLAVSRELSARNEIERAGIARERIYAGRGGGGVEVSVPYETLAADRLVAAEFAPGTSIFDLAPEARPRAAKAILELERDILFADAEVIEFDPDRHPGNSRLVERDGALRLAPIDHGQGLSITRAQRDSIIGLFALAQIVRESGATGWAAEEAARLLGASAPEPRKLRRAMARYFPDRGLERPAAYFSLLAALDDAGVPLDMARFDFIRGIVQFAQYEELAPGAGSPRKALEAAVLARVGEMRGRMRLTGGEKAAYVARDVLGRVESWAWWRGLRHRWSEPSVRTAARALALLALLAVLAGTNLGRINETAAQAYAAASDVLELDPERALRRRLAALTPEQARAELVALAYDDLPEASDAVRAAGIRLLLEEVAAGRAASRQQLDALWFGAVRRAAADERPGLAAAYMDAVSRMLARGDDWALVEHVAEQLNMASLERDPAVRQAAWRLLSGLAAEDRLPAERALAWSDAAGPGEAAALKARRALLLEGMAGDLSKPDVPALLRHWRAGRLATGEVWRLYSRWVKEAPAQRRKALQGAFDAALPAIDGNRYRSLVYELEVDDGAEARRLLGTMTRPLGRNHRFL